MKILILGGNGFIGQAASRRLAADGHVVTALGRDIDRAAVRRPDIQWIRADLATMHAPDDWQDLVAGHTVIVNCAGALQDGLRDDLAAVQERAMLALYSAAREQGGRRIVQISARLDGGGTGTAFLTTKRKADEALTASGLDFTILRPALVVGRNAYGGTALLRALAAMPRLLPLVHGRSPVETVALDDVAEAIALAVGGAMAGHDITLASPERLTLTEAIAAHRVWLGLKPAPAIDLPPWCARPVTLLADLAGKLGWRSPLRSTAMAVMAEGVIGENGGSAHPPFPLKPLHEVLAANPAGAQDLWFARLYLLKGPALVTLSLFWLLSGTIPLLAPERAAAHFAPLMPGWAALVALFATCALDVVLGLAVLYRPLARRALVGMLLVSGGYLAAATLVEPALWLDPLGPLVKVLPSLLLTLTALATLDDR